jgi:hypothetical protein
LGKGAFVTTGVRKPARIAAGIIGAFDGAAWLVLAIIYFWPGSDPATKGLDRAAAWATTILFVVTGAPALVLAVRGRAPRLALTLALAFPIVSLALLIVAVYALP